MVSPYSPGPVSGSRMNWTYSYDKKGRLHEARLDNRLICQCQYDRQGRRQQDYFSRTHGSQMRNYCYRMDNRLQQAGNNGYTHDKQGFRSIWNSGGKYTLYEYAPDYRLLKVDKPDDKVVFEFTHDENGQRECKYRNGEMVEAYTWLDFIWLAGFHDGEIGYRFAYNGEKRTPYAMQREDGVEAYFFYDQVGSLRVVADHSGNVIKEVLYDPFGGIIEDTNPELRIPIGFAGGLHDHDLGFVRFGWRDYDTFTSRWTAPDPMGDAGGDPDWYGYCLDDPVNLNDPTGLIAPLLLFGLGQAGATALAAGGTLLAGLGADSAAKATGKNAKAPFKATKGSMKAMGGAAAINAGITAGAGATVGAIKAAPVATAAGASLLRQGKNALKTAGGKAMEAGKSGFDWAIANPEKVAVGSKGAHDFTSSVVIKGPPEPSLPGYLGVGLSEAYDWYKKNKRK
ncbi:MAG: RHS repeat-associated core domain-containing protein [Pseudodesulfovibrio sp.]|nr:RHS repeat-associated core domain-containing protein [Pseudodesulfovibrio sp.]